MAAGISHFAAWFDTRPASAQNSMLADKAACGIEGGGMVQTLFVICLGAWLGGGLVGLSTGNLLVREISINIFGSLTIILGLVWIGISIGKRGNRGDTPQPAQEAQAGQQADPQPLVTPPPSPPPTTAALSGPTPNQLSDDEMLAKWSGWVRRRHELVMEYDFQGVHVGDGAGKVQIIVNVQRGSFGPLHKLVNFMVVPQIAAEAGYFAMVLRSRSSDATTGFIPVRTSPVPGNATLLNVEDRENADKVFQLLLLGQEMDFTIWAQKEPILRLPLHNDDGFKRQFEALATELRARA
jgi:hypothetical protein